MAVTLTAAQIDLVVEQAWFVIDVTPRVTDTSLGLSGFYGSSSVYSGEGSVTIAYLQKMLANWPRATMVLDVPVAPRRVPIPLAQQRVPGIDSFTESAIEGPALQAGSNFTNITLDDLEALRQAFIVRWGDVVKPNVYLTNGA